MARFRNLIPFGCSLLIGMASFAEPQRTSFTVENKFPGWGSGEVGFGYEYLESEDDHINDVDVSTFSADFRFGVADKLTLVAQIPFYSEIDSTFGEDTEGFGDIRVGLQLLAYEDAFGYPYVIPHLTVQLPTGDEDEDLGLGNTAVTPGITVGTVVDDIWNWALDLSYRIQSDVENQFLVGASLVCDVSDEFAVLGEVRFEEAGGLHSQDSTVLLLGGFVYNWSDSFQFGFNAGTAADGDVNVISDLRATLSF